MNEKCLVISGEMKCNNKMPCREHNFIAYMEEEIKYPPEWAGGSGDE